MLRFAVPILLFVVATVFEFWEHWQENGSLLLDQVGMTEVVVFGLAGPFAVFLTVNYLLHLMTELESARNQTAAINRNLEEIVTARTAALQLANAELEQANARLRELDQMKSDFVALVSHELRAPLATLNGGLEVALQDQTALPSRTQRVLELIFRETQRLSQFVQTLLDVSQLEAGKLNLICGPMALKPVLRRAVEVVCGDEAARVVWRVPDQLPPILADETYFEQVIRNLLRNALKYTPPHSPIELSAAVQPHTMQIHITDHGPGIPSAEQPYIFERFYRGQGSSERHASGWGLGLYFARALTEAQGGTLTLQSPAHPDPAAPGCRLTITMTLAEEEVEDGETVVD